MAKYSEVRSKVIPLIVDNVDTDQIIPARFLKATDKNGFGDLLFADWRYNADGTPKADFPLNDPLHRGASVLLAGGNFGCGSSREHAPWALTAFGLRAIISTSFADIFCSNAMKNGLLPVVITPEQHQSLAAELNAAPDGVVKIELDRQELTTPSGKKYSFPIDAFSKYCLLNGVDELEYLRHRSNQSSSQPIDQRLFTCHPSTKISPSSAPATWGPRFCLVFSRQS
jgi:3-isopropylmalate/(R)-2-methylmalate dehydratase small subunit